MSQTLSCLLIKNRNLNTYVGIKNCLCPGGIHHLEQWFSTLGAQYWVPLESFKKISLPGSHFGPIKSDSLGVRSGHEH